MADDDKQWAKECNFDAIEHPRQYGAVQVLAAECRALEQELAELKIEHNGPCDSYGLCLRCATRLDRNNDLLKALTLAQAELAASKERIEELVKSQESAWAKFIALSKDDQHRQLKDAIVTQVKKAREAEAEVTRLQAVVDVARNATCDSSSGMNCEDDSCANKILPPALAAYDALSTPATAPQKAGEGL